jgi:hypothetical protein
MHTQARMVSQKLNGPTEESSLHIITLIITVNGFLQKYSFLSFCEGEAKTLSYCILPTLPPPPSSYCPVPTIKKEQASWG